MLSEFWDKDATGTIDHAQNAQASLGIYVQDQRCSNTDTSIGIGEFAMLCTDQILCDLLVTKWHPATSWIV